MAIFTLLLTCLVVKNGKLTLTTDIWQIKNGNFSLLLMSSGQKWQIHINTDMSRGEEWQVNIGTDI